MREEGAPLCQRLPTSPAQSHRCIHTGAAYLMDERSGVRIYRREGEAHAKQALANSARAWM